MKTRAALGTQRGNDRARSGPQAVRRSLADLSHRGPNADSSRRPNRGVRVVAAGEGTATESATADWEEEDRVAELNEELMPDEARSRTS